jgi:hypothetical protein
MLSRQCLAYATSRAGLRLQPGNASRADRLVKQTRISLRSFFDIKPLSHFFALLHQHHFRAVNWLTRTPQ